MVDISVIAKQNDLSHDATNLLSFSSKCIVHDFATLFFQNFKELYLIQLFINCLALLNLGSCICKLGAHQFLEPKTTLLNFRFFRFFERLYLIQFFIDCLALLEVRS